MRRPKLIITGLVLALLVTAPASALAAPGNSGDHAPLYYVALGTSLSVGIQPDADGENQRTDQGYPDQLHGRLQGAMPNLRLVKLGCPAETTFTMIAGGLCDYPKGSQLAEATSFLHAHRQFVTLVTLDLGANDIKDCAAGDTINLVCVEEAFDSVTVNLPRVLTALREAAGPDVPIVAMNYYNPFVAAWLQGADGRALAQLSALLLTAFNAVLEGIYGEFSVPVGDVAAAFHFDDFTPLPSLGGIPLNVALVCQWTWMCVFPPLGPNIHPNDIGYAVIGDAFEAVLP